MAPPYAPCDATATTLTEWALLLALLAAAYVQLSPPPAAAVAALYGRVRAWAAPRSPLPATPSDAWALVPHAGATWVLMQSPTRPALARLMVPGWVFGPAWVVFYAGIAATVWAAATARGDAALPPATLDRLLATTLAHLALNKLWTPVFWAGAAAGARAHDMAAARSAGGVVPRSVAAVPAGAWLWLDGAGRPTPPGRAGAIATLLASLALIVGNLVTAGVVADALRGAGRGGAAAAWGCYCAWLAYATFLNALSAAYYWP